MGYRTGGQSQERGGWCVESTHTPMIPLLGGALAGKIFVVDPSGPKSEHSKELFTLLDLGSFLKVLKIVGKSLPHPVGVFCALPNPPKCHIMQNLKICCVSK